MCGSGKYVSLVVDLYSMIEWIQEIPSTQAVRCHIIVSNKYKLVSHCSFSKWTPKCSEISGMWLTNPCGHLPSCFDFCSRSQLVLSLAETSNSFVRYKAISPLSISSTAYSKCDTTVHEHMKTLPTIINSSRDLFGVGRVPRSSKFIALEVSV
jgi:hypothetical protein